MRKVVEKQKPGAVQARFEIRLDEVSAKDRLAFWVDQVCAASARADSEIADRAALAGRLSHLRVADLAINEIVTCAQSFRRTPSHLGRDDEEVFAILLQRGGTSTIAFNGASPRRLLPGDLSINSGAQPGVWHLGDDADVLLTVVPSALMRQSVGFAHEDGAVPIARDTPLAQLLTLFLSTLQTRADTLSQDGARHLRDGLLQTVAAALEPNKAQAGADAGRLAAYHRARIERFFMQHLHEPALDIATIARGVHLSVSQVHRLFAGQPGGGVMHRVWQARLECSRKLLEIWRGRSCPIAEIGWRCGFQSAAHFSRSFKERFGATPSEWRARAQTMQAALSALDAVRATASAEPMLAARVKSAACWLLCAASGLASGLAPGLPA